VALTHLRIAAVRCIEHADTGLGSDWTYVFGPNGAGKTSFLEAIYVLGRGRSFRTRHLERLITAGRRELAVAGAVVTDGRHQEIRVRFREGELESQVGADENGGLVALARAFPVHVIDPQLHDLIEGGPSARRRYLDAGVFHVERSYLESWRAYRRALQQRNHALRQSAHDRELAAWTAGLALTGAAVDEARRRYVERLHDALVGIGQRLLQSPLDIDYRPGWRHALTLPEALEESLLRDRSSGFTQVGPHRADLVVRLAKQAVRDVASRGQQKLVAASLVLAQVRTYAAVTGHGGTLLVDDPAAELDAAALARLIDELEGTRAQLVITALSETALPQRSDAARFHVEHGRVVAMV